MVNIHTWTRLTRFDLQHLSISLGNAAMEELSSWPVNGDGRTVKALTEQITRTLEGTLDRRDLNYSFDIIEDVISKFNEIRENGFYQKSISKKPYVDRKGVASNYEEALSSKLQRFVDFVGANRPPRPVPKVIRAEAPAKPPATAPDVLPLHSLSEVVPAQQSAPLKFEVRDGQLRTKRQTAKSAAEDRKSITSAKAALQYDANSLLGSLGETNADPRLSAAISEIRDILSSDADVIRLGIVSLSCDSLVRKFSEQLPDIVSAKLEAFSTSLSLFVGQFPEWQRFVDNANSSVSLNENDVAVIYAVSTYLVGELRKDSSLVDPQVPRSVELLSEAIRDPRQASKRAVFGVVRTLENLIGTIFVGFGGVVGSTFSGLKDGVRTSTKVVAATLIIGAAIHGASTLSPSVSKLVKSNWLEQASRIMERALEK